MLFKLDENYWYLRTYYCFFFFVGIQIFISQLLWIHMFIEFSKHVEKVKQFIFCKHINYTYLKISLELLLSYKISFLVNSSNRKLMENEQ